MLSPTKDREAKCSTACHGPCASSRSTEGDIRKVGDDEPHPFGNRSTVPLTEVIQHDHLRTLPQQQLNNVATDIAGTAGDKVAC